MPLRTSTGTMHSQNSTLRMRVAGIALGVGLLLYLCSSAAAAVSGIVAERKSGQLFLSWTESGASSYEIYRSNSPISDVSGMNPIHVADAGSANIPRLTNYSPAFRDGANPSMGAITRVCFEDFAQLPAGSGAFVRDCDTTGSFYYAVLEQGSTTVVPGENSTLFAVDEALGLPHLVQISTYGGNLCRMYMYYMDSASWDSDDGHFAYIQQVILPDGFDPSQTYPLWVSGHGWGDGGSKWNIATDNGGLYDWQCVRIMIDDYRNTWYFGNKNRAGTAVGNYSEARILQGVMGLVENQDILVDSQRIYFRGQSMGGSGAISMGLRYPNIFAACFASKGMTKYDPAGWGSADWGNDVRPKWGDPTDHLPLKIVGRWADHLKEYEGTDVYEWQDHQRQIVERRADDMAYLVTTHGSSDNVIPWNSQAVPWYPIACESGHGFAGYTNDSAHSGALWTGSPNFAFAEWGNTYDIWKKFQFRKDVSFPGIIGGSNKNHNILWGCPWLSVAGVNQIVDEPQRWSIVLASDSGTEFIGLIPRRLQNFEVMPGARYSWTVTDVDGNVSYESGSAVADADGILEIPAGSFSVTGSGRRLTITPNATPVFMSGLVALRTSRGAELHWQLAGDIDDARLHVHRQLEGGTRHEITTTALMGRVEEYVDTAAPTGRVDYWLEDRSEVGSIWFGPVPLVGDVPVASLLSMAPPWPNPAVGSTTVSYSLPVGGLVRLSIFDVRGRRVTLVVDERQVAGPHAVQWEGRDRNGNPVAPGTYFARVVFAGGSRSQKISVVR